MAIHDKEVAAIFGIHATTLILNWVKRGAIDAQKMEDIAQLLHPEVGGEHRRRRGLSCNSGEAEMRSILSDWYNREMFEMDRATATKKIISICRCGQNQPRLNYENHNHNISIYIQYISTCMGRHIQLRIFTI